jgi:hypothetical protein
MSDGKTAKKVFLGNQTEEEKQETTIDGARMI